MRPPPTIAISIVAAMAVLPGCTQAPGTQPPAGPQEGSAIPAAFLQARTSVADLVGGDLGLGGGYLIAAAPDKVANHQHAVAVQAARQSEASPATPEQARNATTADLNGDGFITLDEILAMKRAGLNDQAIIDRLRQTGYIYQLTPEQERYLTDRGVSETVTGAIHQLSAAPPAVGQPASAHPATGSAPDRGA